MKVQIFPVWNIQLPVLDIFSNTKQVLNFFLNAYDGKNHMLATIRDLSRISTIYVSSPMYARKLDTIENQMIDCISMLKVFDFLAMYNPSWFSFKKESHTFKKYCQLVIDVATICNQMINPVIWAGKRNIIAINIDKWICIDAYFSIAVSSMQMLKLLSSMKVHREMWMSNLEKKPEEENWCNYLPPKEIRDVPQFEEFQEAILQTKNIEMKNYVLTFIRYSVQTVYFIHYLPKGVLWGGRLSVWQLGALGLVSSVIYGYERKS